MRSLQDIELEYRSILDSPVPSHQKDAQYSQLLGEIAKSYPVLELINSDKEHKQPELFELYYKISNSMFQDDW